MKKIAILSQPEYFRLHYLDFLLYSKYEVKEFILNFGSTATEYSDLIEFKPDILICFRGEYVCSQLLENISGVKIALSSEPFPRQYNSGEWDYTFDSVHRYLEFRRIKEKNFDYIFHYDKLSAELFKLDGITVSGFFNFPISTKSIHPLDVEKKWDISFIGRSSERRESLMIYLKHHYNFLHIAHGVVGIDLNYYLNRSKISLNIHASNEKSWEPRLQILMAAGCPVISEVIPTNDLLIENKHYISFVNADDLKKSVEYCLGHEDNMKLIAANARQLMLEKFDAITYFSGLIDTIDQYPRFSVSPDSKNFDKFLTKLLQKRANDKPYKRLIKKIIKFRK